MSYVICYTGKDGNVWEFASGKDAMQVRVYDLVLWLGGNDNDILVFKTEQQL